MPAGRLAADVNDALRVDLGAADQILDRDNLSVLVVVCGSHAGPLVQLNNNWLFRSRVAIYGSSGSTSRGMRRCLDLAAASRIHPGIDSVRPLRRIREAYADLRSRRNVGKIVLRVSGKGG